MICGETNGPTDERCQLERNHAGPHRGDNGSVWEIDQLQATYDRCRKAINSDVKDNDARTTLHRALTLWIMTQRKQSAETRVCEQCGRATRITTAGCDYCDLEDK